MASARAASTLVKGQWPRFMRNCLPATLVATLKVTLRGFKRTQKPQSMRSRRMRPSRTVARRSKDSLISTIATSFSQAKRGQIPRQAAAPPPTSRPAPGPGAPRESGTSTTPVLGSMVQMGLIYKDFS